VVNLRRNQVRDALVVAAAAVLLVGISLVAWLLSLAMHALASALVPLGSVARPLLTMFGIGFAVGAVVVMWLGERDGSGAGPSRRDW